MEHDTRDQTISHSNPDALSFEGSANGGGTISSGDIERHDLHGIKQFANDLGLTRAPGAGKHFEPGDHGRPQVAAFKFARHSLGSRLPPCQKIDQNVGIRESHRQEARIRVVSVSSRSACCGDRLPRSFSAFRRSASARSSASKYCSIASNTMRENPFSLLRAANSTSLARCSSAISTVVLITSSVYAMHVHVKKGAFANSDQRCSSRPSRAIGQLSSVGEYQNGVCSIVASAAIRLVSDSGLRQPAPKLAPDDPAKINNCVSTRFFWWAVQVSNLRPPACKAVLGRPPKPPNSNKT